MRRFLFALALLTAALPAGAAELTYSFMAGDAAMVNHWPGADGHVGTVDDVVDGNTSPMSGSDPNLNGSYCYNAFDFGSGNTDTGMPPGFNAMTFVDGTVGIDTDVATSGGGPLVTGMEILSGTQPFQGHGPFSASFINVSAGSYDPGTGAFSLTCDFQATLVGGSDQADGMVLTGAAWVLDQADFSTGVGDPYVDDVLVTLAQDAGATSLVYVQVSGTVPAANGGSWPAMPIYGVIVGLATSTATDDSSLSAIKSLY